MLKFIYIFFVFLIKAQVYNLDSVYVQSGNIKLFTRIFQVDDAKVTVIFIHGGGAGRRTIITPLFIAPYFAKYQINSVIYDKRGNDKSGGVLSKSNFGNLINDVHSIINFIAAKKHFSNTKVILVGFSQGGRLAPIVALSNNNVTATVSVSGPMTTVRETRLYAVKNISQQMGLDGVETSNILRFWNVYLDLREANKSTDILNDSIQILANLYHNAILPEFSANVSNSIYNSLSEKFDYVSQMRTINKPAFFIYGELDRIVPIKRSITLLKKKYS